ncbi:MAG: exodeoxyribonuclease VII small subunit [Akkermansia sp.]|nr:exodeoxyribonuclease VII small subunit [Akkermansia sp.]
MPPRTNKDKAMSFEQSMARLEEIAARLEHPETGLEETIALVEEGRRLVASSRKLLDEAELRIRLLENPESAPAPVAANTKDDEDGFSLI